MSVKFIINFTILFFYAIVTVSTQSAEYCDPSLCGGRSNVHIGCPGVAVNKCPTDVRVVDMSLERVNILQKLNRYRNELASGQYGHLPQATRLAEVRWDEELSKLATVHARQCNFAHDKCRNTVEFPWSGQNLFMMTGNRNATYCVEYAVQLWWDEYKATSASDIAKYPR